MRTFIGLLIAVMCPAFAGAQPRRTDATLHVTVVDSSGGVIVGARVTLRAPAPSSPSPSPASEIAPIETGGRGEATFTALDSGRYTIHVESPGFEPADVRDMRVRPGENRREVKLAIARLSETVQVARDPRERGSDPRSDAFATVLGANEINELPDDPDEMQRVLEDMAGPGAVLRVNGFHGGRLPSKDQIAQIRFHRNMFAADAHDPGFISVDIITKPGLENWRGSTNVGWRDSVLNARNAFAPVKGDEHNQRYAFSLNGPLWRKHTSLALSVDGVDAYDSKTIVAALPSGYFADSIRKPSAMANLSARLEHALSPTQMLRVEAQRNHNRLDNQGVGDFDLVERGYRQTRDEDVFRASIAGSIRKSFYNEFRFQRRSQDTFYDAASQAPAVMVLNAFNSGGAQIGGALDTMEFEIADDLDISAGTHAWRAGFLIEGGQYRSDVRRNATGTFTFSSLDAFAAGRPTTFTQNVGDPRVDVSQWQAGFYVQDDYRVRKDLTISGGVREEAQQHASGVHIGPRGGIAWSPFRNGKTTIRAGGGVFFDWFDAQSYEQAVQLDGTHQQVSTVVSPGYPNALSGGQAILLPSGRVTLASDLTLPALKEASVAVERQLPGDIRVSTMFVRRRGSFGLRGVNLNAPLPNGLRPDPTAGTITAVESIAESSFDGLFVNVNYTKPEKRIFVGLNYGLSRTINESDGPFGLPADSRNLAAERGPAAMDARHRFGSLANFPLFRTLMVGTSLRVQSALPYNITTGFDENGDTVSNDRPAGVTRNSGRGSMLVDLGARVTYSIGFGGAARPGPGGPRAVIIRGDNADPLGSMPTGDGAGARYRLELYAQGYNLLNHTNALNFSGVMTSPFFGHATSAASPRRLEIGTRLTF
jgi:Carboxypeptidase regulatory-like domain